MERDNEILKTLRKTAHPIVPTIFFIGFYEKIMSQLYEESSVLILDKLQKREKPVLALDYFDFPLNTAPTLLDDQKKKHVITST